MEVRFETVAGDDEQILIRFGAYGHARSESGGGAMEYVVLVVVTLRDHLFVRAEIFDLDAEDEAYAQLRRADHAATPRGLVEQYVERHNAADWDALARIYTPDVRFVDHRLVGWGALRGGTRSRTSAVRWRR